jgi:hypothetical protein
MGNVREKAWERYAVFPLGSLLPLLCGLELLKEGWACFQGDGSGVEGTTAGPCSKWEPLDGSLSAYTLWFKSYCAQYLVLRLRSPQNMVVDYHPKEVFGTQRDHICPARFLPTDRAKTWGDCPRWGQWLPVGRSLKCELDSRRGAGFARRNPSVLSVSIYSQRKVNRPRLKTPSV